MSLSSRHILRLSLVLILLSSGQLSAGPPVNATATVSIVGSEQRLNYEWDAGTITITFNQFTETVPFGEFSDSESLAAGLAAMFCRDYIRSGLYAKAGANNNTDLNVITFQLTNGQAFGPITYSTSNNSASFGFTPVGFQSTTPSGSPLVVATASLPIGSQNSYYASTLQASGGQAPYTWTYTGQLPSGIQLTAAGRLTGVPLSSGASVITVEVSDSTQAAAFVTLSLVVTAAVTLSQSNSVSYTYDSQGRLHTATYAAGTGSVTVTYSYDNAGNRTFVIAQ